MSGNLELQNLQVQRVVSKLAVGVGGDQDYIAERVLPPVDAGSMNFSYSKWGNEGLRDVEARRALNAEPNKVTISTGVGTAELEEYTLETYYDINRLRAAEEAGNGDLFRTAHIAAIRNLIQIQKEKAVAAVVFAAGNYSGATSSAINFSNTGIRDTVIAAKDARQQATGRRINKAIAGQISHRFLLKNADIADAIKYSKGGITTNQLIAEFLEIDEYIVGTAVSQASAAAGATGTATSLWTADSFALISTDGGTEPNTGFSSNGSTVSQAFAKLFTMNSPLSGSRVAVRTWVPEPGLLERALYSEYFAAVLTFGAAGYLWTNTDQI